MNEINRNINRNIKDLEVLGYCQLFAMALNDILEIAQGDSIQITEERAKMVEARFLRLREDLAQKLKFWERMNNEKDEKIEKLKELVLKQTKTAAKLDPIRKEKYWQRLYDAGFYDGNSNRAIKYVREISRPLEQQNTAD
jgi:hypothetical protein